MPFDIANIKLPHLIVMNMYLLIFAIPFVGIHAKSSKTSSFCEVFQQCPLVASIPEMKTEIEGKT